VLALLIRNLSASWRLVMVIAIESAWEMIENSTRSSNAIASDGRARLSGDTVLNSLGDIFCCAIDSLWRSSRLALSLVLFFTVEAILLFWIRDSLLLRS